MIQNSWSITVRNQTNRFKINHSLGNVLENIETEKLRYYHPSDNIAQVLDTAVLISSAKELDDFSFNVSEDIETYSLDQTYPENSFNLGMYSFMSTNSETHLSLGRFSCRIL